MRYLTLGEVVELHQQLLAMNAGVRERIARTRRYFFAASEAAFVALSSARSPLRMLLIA